jgi:Domain of unknown function (DUF4845)
MLDRQRGLSLWGLVLVVSVGILVAVTGMKLVPVYIEFYTAKGAIEKIASAGGASVAEIRKSFDNRATIDDINSIKGQDLEITKQGNEVVISFAYRREVPLFSNVGVYIEFAASSSKGE